MSNFSAFFAQNKLKPETVKLAVSKNFVDENGKPLEWELRVLSAKEDIDIRRASTRKVKSGVKGGATSSEFDVNVYLSKMTAASVVFPDLNDAELQNSYGVMGSEALLETMLAAGEYITLSGKVAEINGFNESVEELAEEAKN
jgi:hypothetical protein